MIQGTKKIDAFVQQANSLHIINICAFVACVVFFIYLLWVSLGQTYPMMLPLYYSGGVLATSFALKLSMQTSKVLRAEVTDAEYDVLVLALNLVALYLMMETIASFTGLSSVVDFILTFLPGFLCTLTLALFGQDKSNQEKTGGAMGFFHFLKWSLGLGMIYIAGEMLYGQYAQSRFLPLLANLVVAVSPLLVSYLSDRFKKQLRAKFIDEMYRDPLTNIANRKCYYDHYDVWRSQVSKERASGILVVFADIDFFKQYNDHYGHELGDHCLHDVAQAISDVALRISENYGVTLNAYRYGGEEFVLAGKMTLEEARAVMSSPEFIAWQEGEWKLERSHYATPSGHVTISAGTDWLDAETVYRTNAAGATESADKLLYDVKKNGRAWLKTSDNIVPADENLVV